MEKQNLSSKALRRQEADFRIMQAITDNPQISQHELVEPLGLSLGRAHYCLSALIKIGWVKVAIIASSDKKKLLACILTLSGFAHKVAITREFLRRQNDEYAALRPKVERLSLNRCIV